jgi:hypothetical protein
MKNTAANVLLWVVALEVDVKALPKDERDVGPVVLEQLRALVEAGDFEITDDAEGVPLLRVRLRLMEAGDRNYGIHFEFVEGDAVEPAVQWTDCVFCTEARMLQRLESVAPELLAAIEARLLGQPDAGSDTGGVGVGEDVGDESEGDEDDGGVIAPPIDTRAKPIGPLGYAGIGTAVLGLGLTIGGAVEASRGRQYDPACGPDGCPMGTSNTYQELTGTDHRPIGYALLGVGVSAAIAGIVMIGVDVGRRAKTRRPADQRRALIVPIASPAGAGIGVSGHF